MHVHLEVDDCGHKAMPQERFDVSSKYFHAQDRTPSINRIAEIYREQRMAAVLFTIDARTALRHEPNSIEDLVEGATRTSLTDSGTLPRGRKMNRPALRADRRIPTSG